MPDGSVRLARGDTGDGPAELLDAGLTVAGILAGSADDLGAVVRDSSGVGSVPSAARVLAPVDSQEIWAAGARRCYSAVVGGRTAPRNAPRRHAIKRAIAVPATTIVEIALISGVTPNLTLL
jgi:hypothetical protein